MESVERFIIYGLVDPRTDEVRYIGKSEAGRNRFWQHTAPSHLKEKTHRTAWIKSLLNAGLMFSVRVLESLPTKDGLADAERHWIANARRMGWALTNLTDGGDGRPGYETTAATRSKMSTAIRAALSTPEARRKISAGMLGHHVSDETKAKISAAMRGRKLSDEHRAKVSAAGRGRKMSPEAIAKSLEKRRGFRHTAESRMKMSAARRARLAK